MFWWYKRDRLKLKLLFLIQQCFNPAPEYREKNIKLLYPMHLYFFEYSGAGSKNCWIRNNNFNFSLTLSFTNIFVFSQEFDIRVTLLEGTFGKIFWTQKYYFSYSIIIEKWPNTFQKYFQQKRGMTHPNADCWQTLFWLAGLSFYLIVY